MLICVYSNPYLGLRIMFLNIHKSALFEQSSFTQYSHMLCSGSGNSGMELQAPIWNHDL
jgi:hypothetical protein